MRLKTKRLIKKARREVENEMNIKLPDTLAEDVLQYCIRKLACINKDEEYLPILYRCELPLQVQMKAITEFSLERMRRRKEEKNVRYLLENAMRFTMSERA